jgi:diguanylate cyclase (GGDEF)-like protein
VTAEPLVHGSTGTPRAIDLAHGAHYSGGMVSTVLRWVRGQVGDDGVARMLAQAGETRAVEVLEDASQWHSYRQVTALYEAAVEVTGRPDAGRRIGEETLAQHRGTAVADLLRSLGSPEALLESIAASGHKFSTVFTLTPNEVAPGRAVVAGVSHTGVPRHRLLCDNAVGILSIIPTVFDLPPAVVTHEECQARGAAQCVYTLTWDPTASPEADADQRIQQLENRLEIAQTQLAALRATASEIVASTDVHVTLETITRRAAAAVPAPGHLLAVRMPSEERVRVHAHGLLPDDADALAADLTADGAADAGLVVEVASTTRRYGVLAALLADGSAYFPQERELLVAYAGYAASVLDTAWALEEARRQNDTARALLDLSRALAEVTTPAELAQRLASAVCRVVGCDQSTVLLWDDADERLRLGGSVAIPPAVDGYLRDAGIGLDDTPAVRAMLDHPAPLFLSADEPDAYLRELMARAGGVAAVVVPIVSGGRFLGVVTAAVTTDSARLDRNRDLLERLEGIAHQAATALTNARLVAELQRQARHDALTGLPNRALLADRIEHELTRSRRDGTDCALLFLDLDRFKQVNDTLGHLVGDQLLVEVAQRLCATVRAADTVARLAGDEFAVLLPGVGEPDDALEVADRLLDALAEPFHFAGHEFFVTTSIGISVGRQGAGTGTELLREADAAMYSAKSCGGGAAHVSAAVQPQRRHSPLYLIADLRTAVDAGRLDVAYQPLVDVHTGAVVGAEALVRWTHPDLGPVAPGEFLPLAEDTELGVDIDLAVLDDACTQLRRWCEVRPQMRVAVNVSRRTLTSPRLLAAVSRHLADGSLHGLVELEVTERLLDADPEQVAGHLAPLRAAGATVAVDDFGTGSSGFARLRHSQVDTLKIDRSFLAEIDSTGGPAPVLEAMLGMGAALGLQVVAEGVEREVERRWLLRAGCPVAQGFLLGRPAPAATVARLLRVAVPAPTPPADDALGPLRQKV